MRVRSLLLALSLLPGAALAVAATTPEGCVVAAEGDVATSDDDVLACEAAAYLAGCDQAVGGKVWSQLVSGTVPTALTAPDTSFTAGAGCGTYEEPLFVGGQPGNPFYDLTIEGFVEGNLDTLYVELHDIYVGPQRAGGDVTLDVRVEVDGTSLFGTSELELINGDIAQTPSIISVPITPEVSSTGVSEALRFSVAGLQDMFPGVAGDGAGTFHSVRVTVSVPPGGHVIVWDATEIPSGFYVNQGTAGTVLQLGTGAVIS